MQITPLLTNKKNLGQAQLRFDFKENGFLDKFLLICPKVIFSKFHFRRIICPPRLLIL